MDTSNYHIDFFGTKALPRKIKELTPISNSPKTIYRAQIHSDSDSDEPCRCLQRCISCSGENEDTNKETLTPETPNIEIPKNESPKNNCLPKHIKRSIEALQSIKDRVLNSDKLDDEFSYLGKNIACQLRQLPISEALNLQLEILKMLKEKREAAESAKLDRSSSSSYTTEYTFEIQNTVSKVDSLKEITNAEKEAD